MDTTSLSASEWSRINHSDHLVRWKRVTCQETLKDLQTLFLQHRSARDVGQYKFYELREKTSSKNFAVCNAKSDGAFFLRLHVAPHSYDRLIELQRLKAKVLEDEEFNEGRDRGLDSCLLAMKSRSGATLLAHPLEGVNKFLVRDRDNAPVRHSELFRCAPIGITHYPFTDPALISFASQFGKLQRIIHKHADGILRARGGTGAFLYNPVTAVDAEVTLETDVRLFFEKFRSEKSKCYEVCDEVRVWEDHEHIIAKWGQYCTTYLNNRRSYKSEYSEQQCFHMLHDVHPHNTFFRGNECMLIYDFEQVDRFSHGDAVAFSVHRFIRELIRVRGLAQNDWRHEIDRYVQRFIEAYQKHGPELPPDFRETLGLRIATTSLYKLIEATRYIVDSRLDRARRGADFNFQEIYKFVSMLKEAEYFMKGRSSNRYIYTGLLSSSSGIVARLDELRQICDSLCLNQDDVKNALILLAAFGDLAEMAVQKNRFQGEMKEPQFQKHVEDFLTTRPGVGLELDRQTVVGAGRSDLSLKGIQIELKCPSHPIRSVSACKDEYFAQIRPYAVGSGKRLCLLCVLDCSIKDKAVFLPEEGIGIDVDEKLVIITVLIQGNLPPPSQLKNRKPRVRSKVPK